MDQTNIFKKIDLTKCPKININDIPSIFKIDLPILDGNHNKYLTINFNMTKFIISKNITYMLVSMEHTNNNEPLLEIIYSINEKEYEGKLKFIRSSAPYTYLILINIFLCLSKILNITKLVLLDNSRFFNNNKSESYSATLYRIFENKLSLYITEKTGFLPSLNIIKDYTMELYLEDIKFLSKISFGELVPFYNKIFSNMKFYINDLGPAYNIYNKHKEEYKNEIMGSYLKKIRMEKLIPYPFDYKYINFLLERLRDKRCKQFINTELLRDIYTRYNKINEVTTNLTSIRYIYNVVTIY
jgi:hypothetical protein